MVVLNFVVRGSVLSARDKLPQVTTRSNKFFTLNVELDDVWSEYTVTVFFSNKAKPDAAEDVFPVLLHDGSCIVPHEVLDASDITAYMWLMGLKDDVRATTNIIPIPLTASGYLEGIAPEEPTPDVYTEILESVRGAYNIANDVRADADAGKFNGEPGPKGDPGEGVPAGGATGQVLTKASDADYDTEWRTPSGGGSGNITVDAALSGTSTNPVQNKVIKAALDGKAGTGVATPGANGLMSAADKKKLDSVGAQDLLNAPILTSPVMIRKFGETESAGVYLSTIDTGEKAAEIKFEDVNENSPVAIANLRTPTGTGTDDYAATKGYVDSTTPTIGTNGNWYIRNTDTGKPSRGEKGDKGEPGAAGAPGKDGAGMDITGAAVGQIAKITAVDASGVPIAWSPADMPSGGGSADAVLHTAQTLTEAQRRQARKNIGALGAVTPTIRGGLFVLESDPAGTPIQVQALGYQQSATGEEYSELSITDTSPQATNDQIIISGLADFGDAEAVGRTDTAVSYAQLLGYTKPLTLNYANGQATGASYADIRKAITRGRQIKLAVANTPDIIASNAKNETDKCVLRFIHTDVGGDAVNITQYTVTAQASGLTVNVKSHEIAMGAR